MQRKLENISDSSLFIKSQLDLAGKTLHVVKGSPSILRIRNLGNEIGDTIYVEEIEKYGSEQLIALVAHGDIDYAVCDESIARTAADSIPQIDINTAISFTQFYSWGVSKQSPILLDSLNTWLDSFKKGKRIQENLQTILRETKLSCTFPYTQHIPTFTTSYQSTAYYCKILHTFCSATAKPLQWHCTPICSTTATVMQ